MFGKKFAFIMAVLFSVAVLSSCSKKQPSLEEMQQPMSPEELSRISSQEQNVSTPVNENLQVVSVAMEGKPLQVAQSVSVKPTNEEIQTALKNALYYTGSIDGKIGPKSKMAIEEFQKANGLVPDGKVGSKTWAVLSKYLNPEPQPAPVAVQRLKKR